MGIPDGCCNINIQVNVKAGKVAVTADRGGMGMSSGDSASCSPAAARLPSSPESSSTLPKVSLEPAKTKAVKKEPCAKKLDFDATTKCEASGLDKVRGFLQARRAQQVNSVRRAWGLGTMVSHGETPTHIDPKS